MIWIMFVWGLIMGSFYNVVIYRLPRGQSLLYPRSACPHCGKALGPGELIPLVSYMILRGQCRACKAPIGLQYPLVELVTGLGFAFVGWRATSLGQLIAGLLLFSLLLLLGFIDAKHKILPNVLTVGGTLFGIAFSILGWTISWQQSLWGSVTGGGVILIIALLSRGGMGIGDIKLLAMIGSFLGTRGALYTLFGGSFIGSVFGIVYLYRTRQDRKTPIPFGPFLAIAAFVIYGKYLWS